MYRLIAIDGKEYGPVTADAIRAWIAQDRADGSLKARLEGTDEWKHLGEFPDFVGALAEKKINVTSTEPQESTDSEQISTEDYSINIGECFRRSWQNFRSNLLLSWVGLIVFCLLEFAVHRYVDIYHLTALGAAVLLVAGTAIRGVNYYFLQIGRGEGRKFKPVLSALVKSFLPLLLLGIITTVFIFAGLLLLVLPGIYLGICWAFASMLVLDKKMPIFQALAHSRRRVSMHWWQCFVALVTFTIVGVSGLVAFGVGLLVTLPLMLGAVAAAYEQIFGDSGTRPL